MDNLEAYETISWILDNADAGFFIVTAPSRMQQEIAEQYKTNNVGVYDFASSPLGYSYAKLRVWVKAHQEMKVFFILNMQLALQTTQDMLNFNMSRDVLAKEKKIWLFFMTKDTDDRLATFAYDIYSYVRQKAHFKLEKDDDFERPQNIPYGTSSFDAKERLMRYAELEKQLMSLSLDGAESRQLLAAALSLSNIAQLYKDCTEYEKALELFERVKDIREKALGVDHTDTATAYNDMAEIYYRQGRFVEALDWCDKALVIREGVLGREHPDTATTYNNIALVYDSQGRYEEALEWYSKALIIMEKVLGKNHPSTITVQENYEITLHKNTAANA